MTELLKDKNSIIAWLDKYNISDYTLVEHSDGISVDVNDRVVLSEQGLTSIDVQFRSVQGCFLIENNYLTSLMGAPTNVEGDFDCSHNNLTSLEFSPRTVNGDFFCDNNLLIDLEGLPQYIENTLWCDKNRLTNLEAILGVDVQSFYCAKNPELREYQNIMTIPKLRILIEKKLASALIPIKNSRGVMKL